MANLIGVTAAYRCLRVDCAHRTSCHLSCHRARGIDRVPDRRSLLQQTSHTRVELTTDRIKVCQVIAHRAFHRADTNFLVLCLVLHPLATIRDTGTPRLRTRGDSLAVGSNRTHVALQETEELAGTDFQRVHFAVDHAVA